MTNSSAPFMNPLLGAGGPEPGLWVVGPSEGQVSPLIELAEGHSVYAFDALLDERRVVLGTRAGMIEVLSWPAGSGPPDPPEHWTLAQGAPVLSVCALGDSQFVSADTAGRCFLWPLSQHPGVPVSIEGYSGCVCSLLRLPDGRMAGLTTAGTLLLWDVGCRKVMDTVEGPAPPSAAGLVHLQYWPAKNSLVYPAVGGDLAFVGLDGPTLRVAEAHQGECYAVFTEGGLAYSVGREDGVMKAWSGPNDAPSDSTQAPRGIVSAEAMPGGASRFLLINGKGKASVYARGGKQLRLLYPLPGSHYRRVACPSAEARETHAEQLRAERANELCAQLRGLPDGPGGKEAEALHGELAALGFPGASLTLRAEEAERRNDLAGELRARLELARTLPSDDPRTSSSWRRLAAVHEKVWQLAEARDIHEKAADADGGTGAPDWLGKAAEILEGQDWVVEPDVPLPLLIEAASIADRPFSGRWLLRAAEPLAFPDACPTADELASKYELIKKEKGQNDLPVARTLKVWWVSRGLLTERETVIFDDLPTRSAPGTRLAIQIRPDHESAPLLPLILFEAPRPEGHVSPQEHNARALQACLAALHNGAGLRSFRRVQRVLKTALQRLRTQAHHSPPG